MKTLRYVIPLFLVAGTNGIAAEVASFDNGERIVAVFNWKIEHAQRSFGQLIVDSIGTKEGRAVLGTALTAIGLDPATATIISTTIPLPGINAQATDNKGTIRSPQGMTICKVKPIGRLEMSKASWSASIVRNANENGLAYYTSVGTSPGDTHRVMGKFAIEFVKANPGWEQKYSCAPPGTVWNVKNGYFN